MAALSKRYTPLERRPPPGTTLAPPQEGSISGRSLSSRDGGSPLETVQLSRESPRPPGTALAPSREGVISGWSPLVPRHFRKGLLNHFLRRQLSKTRDYIPPCVFRYSPSPRRPPWRSVARYFPELQLLVSSRQRQHFEASRIEQSEYNSQIWVWEGGGRMPTELACRL